MANGPGHRGRMGLAIGGEWAREFGDHWRRGLSGENIPGAAYIISGFIQPLLSFTTLHSHRVIDLLHTK